MNNPVFKKEALKNFLLIGALFLIVVLVFSAVQKSVFVNWDDPAHIINNYLIRPLDLAHVNQIFQSAATNGYIPLTMLSFALEYHFVKLNPFLYHLDNLIFHFGIVVLIFILAQQIGLSRRAAYFAALLFGIHPIHVEPVMWVTARKDVLYGIFYMLALCQYVQYVRNKKFHAYCLTLFFGFLSILAKPMALSLPLIFFVFDWLLKRKFDRNCVIDKIPHFLYIIPITWLTYSFFARMPPAHDISHGILVWIWTFIFYIRKFVFPFVLTPVYELPEPVALHNPQYYLSVFAFIAWLALLIVLRKDRWFIFSQLVYVFSVFFLLRYDNADKVFVADRYMYLPSMGVCIFIGVFFDRRLCQASHNFLRKWKIWFFVIMFYLVLSVKSYSQTQIWKDSLALWNHEIKYYPRMLVAYNDRTAAFVQLGRIDSAIADCEKAIEIDPDNDKAHNNRGVLFNITKQYSLALNEFNKANRINPHNANVYFNRAITYSYLKQYDRSLLDYNMALAIESQYVGAYINRGILYRKLSRTSLAMEDFNQALSINPEFDSGYVNRGNLYSDIKEYNLALQDYTTAIRLNPKQATAYNQRSKIYQLMGNFSQSLEDAAQAKTLGFSTNQEK